MEFETIKITSTVTLSMVINIEDFDHKVEVWKGAVDGPYIYVEDLVKHAGIVQLLFKTNGQLVYQQMPDCFTHETFREHAFESL